MRVLHVINSLRFGGAEKIVFSLVRELSNTYDNISTEVCTLAGGGAWEQELKSGGIVVHTLGRNEYNALGAMSNMYGLIKNGSYDIVHAHLWPTLYYVAVLRTFLPQPTFVFTEHNTWNRRRNHFLFRVLESMAYRNYDLIIANSTETKRALSSWIPQLETKVTVIENGVEIPASRKRSYHLIQPICLLTVGRLVRQKGVDIVIEALRNLIAEGLDVRLTVVGDGPERIALEKQASQLPVEFKGWHASPDTFMADHDIFLMPSRWEGFGLTAIEAAIVGVPIIASRTDALKRLVSDGKTGLLFEVESSSELTAKIKDLIKDPQRLSTMAAANRQQALRKWTIQQFARDTMTLYKDLCKTEQSTVQPRVTELTS